MKTLVTDIQRFSLSDGEGIRTTVFLKGCNMKCAWCHNPETISSHPELMFYRTKCIGCGKCFEVCPTGAHQLVHGEHVINREACISCGKCTEVCYAEALATCGKEMTVEEIVKEVVQDKKYYDNSGGGVTISGGEVLCNLDFSRELAIECNKAGIAVAIETNLSFPFEKIKPLLTELSMVMCDIKLFDDGKHKEYTGISNKTILENVRKLDELSIPFIVRTPLIPGVTDSRENISAIAEYLRSLKNLVRYELLNFNPLGEAKYRGLDRDNSFESVRPLQEDSLEALRRIVESHGVSVKIV